LSKSRIEPRLSLRHEIEAGYQVVRRSSETTLATA
jgi:hypothetical protein